MAGASTIAMSSVGSTMFISPILPATTDAQGFGAVTGWLEIGELDSIPPYGPKSDSVKRTPLKKNVTQKLKGARDYGSLTPEMGYAPGDVGQAALIAQEKVSAAASFKVVLPDGTIEYFEALVMSYERGPNAAGDFVKATSMLDITSAVVSVYPT